MSRLVAVAALALALQQPTPNRPSGATLEGIVVRDDTATMRGPSSIDQEKQLARIERARRMTPEERLLACANISRAGLELQHLHLQAQAAIQGKHLPGLGRVNQGPSSSTWLRAQ
jgi:hypothetical protein